MTGKSLRKSSGGLLITERITVAEDACRTTPPEDGPTPADEPRCVSARRIHGLVGQGLRPAANLPVGSQRRDYSFAALATRSLGTSSSHVVPSVPAFELIANTALQGTKVVKLTLLKESVP